MTRASLPSVALVREQVPEAAGGERPQQPCQIGIARLVLPQVRAEVAEAGSLAGLRVAARQGVVKGGSSLRAEALSHHDLDDPPEAADAPEELAAGPWRGRQTTGERMHSRSACRAAHGHRSTGPGHISMARAAVRSARDRICSGPHSASSAIYLFIARLLSWKRRRFSLKDRLLSSGLYPVSVRLPRVCKRRV